MSYARTIQSRYKHKKGGSLEKIQISYSRVCDACCFDSKFCLPRIGSKL